MQTTVGWLTRRDFLRGLCSCKEEKFGYEKLTPYCDMLSYSVHRRLPLLVHHQLSTLLLTHQVTTCCRPNHLGCQSPLCPPSCLNCLHLVVMVMAMAAVAVAAAAVVAVAALSLAGTHVLMLLIGGREDHGTHKASLAEIKLHGRGFKKGVKCW